MIFQSGRSVASLRSHCLRSRRTLFTSSTAERAPALYALLSSSNNTKAAFKPSFINSILRRSYADKPVSRPKAHTGRTTTAARRAPSTSATKAAKKPAPKTKAAKAVPKTKSKAKPRIKPKPKPRKKAKAKPKPKRKALTDKQKTAKTVREKREKLRDLKALALLRAVKPTPASAWAVYMAERVKADCSGRNGAKIGDVAKETSTGYKAMTPEQLEHYNHLANQNKAANNAAFQKWVESYTPQQIKEANLARLSLKRLVGSKSSSKYSPIKDDRQVKGPQTPFILFYQDRQASGDYKGLKVPEASRLAGREWKALSAAEKKPFEDTAAQDKQRHSEESKTVYNK